MQRMPRGRRGCAQFLERSLPRGTARVERRHSPCRCRICRLPAASDTSTPVHSQRDCNAVHSLVPGNASICMRTTRQTGTLLTIPCGAASVRGSGSSPLVDGSRCASLHASEHQYTCQQLPATMCQCYIDSRVSIAPQHGNVGMLAQGVHEGNHIGAHGLLGVQDRAEGRVGAVRQCRA